MDYFVPAIAITGTAAISAAGVGIKPALEALTSGVSCLKPIPDDLVAGTAGQYWGKADLFKATDFIPPLKARKLDRASQFAVAAAGLALADAGIARGAFPSDRIGIALGSGFGGIANASEFLSGYYQAGVSGLSPMLFPNTVANAAASNASIEYGLQGPNITFIQRFCSAESAILAACRFIEEGRADIMLAGGVDELTPQMMRGFSVTGQLTRYASGFGEGCGMLVLERADHARCREAAILAQITTISTIGLLLPGLEQTGINRLLQRQQSCDRLSISGIEQAAEPFTAAVQATTVSCPGRLIGRSLAMGGTVLGLLTASLQPGEQGLHLAASPEGPYYAISVQGGDAAES
ncbi:MAG: beta-ketoacyl synthase [Trichlorobacter sp.]|uniref:beta-ketoacyl synthase N-terminal-like domain-containing protein n=1 Tax=Trichlorobacter sp. TaxID=2911007 RepID=UPI00256A9BF5|nr:beta-ketoacyl synthase N-terminal-like domain-containing protein [Trichlorobacter sp.]MDK9718228.1 beta-ketoacyl synthase [Trichlorobacter sp.]